VRASACKIKRDIAMIGARHRNTGSTRSPLARQCAQSFGKYLLTASAICVLLFGPTDVACAQDYRSAGSAPPSWTKFAKLVRVRFEEWIGADDAVANRFRSYVREHAGKEDGPPPALEVRAWLNPDGTVERVTFPPLKNAQADDDLHTILKRGRFGVAPPQEMLQPLNLRFSLNIK
jgi:hypothetical protein